MRIHLTVLAVLAASAVQADPVVGVWKTEPDRKDLVSHIRIAPCGGALCGTVEKAFDASGNAVATPNVGKRLFWDLRPAGRGAYEDGTVRVPLLEVTADARARLEGDSLTVIGCKGPVCDGQVWTRVD